MSRVEQVTGISVQDLSASFLRSLRAEKGRPPVSRSNGSWSNVGIGRRDAKCGIDRFYEQPADRRTRLDPLDPSTSRHAGQCEHRDTSDPALLRAILKVRDGAGGGYWWVECSACDCGWQVSHFSAENGG